MEKSKYDYKPLLIVWKDRDENESLALIDGVNLESCIELARKGLPSKGDEYEIWTRDKYPKSKGKLIYSKKQFSAGGFCDS